MANRFWVGGTDTWDATAASKWSTTTGGAGGSAIPGTADTAIFDGGSGAAVVTVAASIGGTNTIAGITFTGTGNFAGTLDFATNNPSLTMASFSITGTGTRTVNLGSGTFTLTTVNGNAWDATTITGLTFNAGTSTLVTTGTITGAKVLNLNTLTYSTISIGAQTVSNVYNFTGSPTIGTLNIAAPVNVTFLAGTTTTITNAFNWVGSSANQFSINSSAANSAATISVATGTPTISWAALRTMAFTGGATFTATSSFNNLSNTGITITPPSGAGGGVVIGS